MAAMRRRPPVRTKLSVGRTTLVCGNAWLSSTGPDGGGSGLSGFSELEREPDCASNTAGAALARNCRRLGCEDGIGESRWVPGMVFAEVSLSNGVLVKMRMV